HGDVATLRSALVDYLPRRLAERWAENDPAAVPVAAKPVAMLSNDAIQSVAAGLHRWTVRPSGTEGFEKAEVTAGGVDTNELSSKSMESKKAPGLYFIGEVVDVTGWLGGYNFQWAWSSGYACAEAMAGS
ncbi:MAG: NAD(P)/FAD-dependent oxidoreductase, partial [Bryobacteraceae bacterium]